MAYPRPFIRDISKYDAPPYRFVPIPWKDYDAIIIRDFDGTDADPRFLEHRARAIENGKAWWPYMFYDFRVPAEGQVEEAIRITHDNLGHAPMMIDVEEWSGFVFPERSIMLNGMKVLYDAYLNITGMKPQWYLSAVAGIHKLKPIPDWLLSCPLHVADWRSILYPEHDPWVDWTIHQYQGEPDLNHFNGTVEQFTAWLTVPPPTPLPPPPPPPLPEYVIVNSDKVNLRCEASSSKLDATVIGWTVRGRKIYGIEGIEKDEHGDEWYKFGKRAYIAKWLTRLP